MPSLRISTALFRLFYFVVILFTIFTKKCPKKAQNWPILGYFTIIWPFLSIFRLKFYLQKCDIILYATLLETLAIFAFELELKHCHVFADLYIRRFPNLTILFRILDRCTSSIRLRAIAYATSICLNRQFL